ncbi:MAG: TRAP transporter substrate-binding protein [Aquisalimonadaceae bacterium]
MRGLIPGIAGAVFALAASQAMAQAPEVEVPYVKEATKTARLAHGVTEQMAYHTGAERFAELVEAYTQGAVKVDIYPNAQLGLEQDTAKDTQLGVLEMTLVAINNASMWYPPLDVTILPFMFRDREHVNAVVNGPVGKDLFEEYHKASGMRIISVMEWGDRGVLNSKRSIEEPSDFEGIKIRLPKNSVMLDTYNALGANPTAIDWGELYGALQQGVADGLEGPPHGMVDMKFTDFLKFYSYVPVFHGLAVVLVNDDWFNALTPAQQEGVLRAGREAGDYQRWVSAKAHVGGLGQMAELGVTVNAPENLDAFMTAVEPVWDKYRDDIGDEWIKRVESAE